MTDCSSYHPRIILDMVILLTVSIVSSIFSRIISTILVATADIILGILLSIKILFEEDIFQTPPGLLSMKIWADFDDNDGEFSATEHVSFPGPSQLLRDSLALDSFVGRFELVRD